MLPRGGGVGGPRTPPQLSDLQDLRNIPGSCAGIGILGELPGTPFLGGFCWSKMMVYGFTRGKC